MGEKEKFYDEYNDFNDKTDKEDYQNNNQNDNHNQSTEYIDNFVDNNSKSNDRIEDINPSKILTKKKPSKKAAYFKSVSPDSNKFNYYSSTNGKIASYYTNKKRERSHYTKKHPDQKLGRKTNEEKERGEKGKHTSDDYDLWKKKVFEECLLKLYDSMNYLSLKKYKIGLYPPTLSPLLEKNTNCCLIKFSEYTVKDIFLSSKQRNIGKNYSERIKINIEKILKKDEENPNEKIKLLTILFNKKFKEILLEMYLKEYHSVKHFDGYTEANFYLNGFKTIKDSFKYMDPEKKKRYKQKISDLLKEE